MAANDIATWAVVIATLLGPVLAIQTQKWVERAKEKKSRKTWIVQTLMATQGQRLALDHVRALNMIDLAFYGTRYLGQHRRSDTEQNVIETWYEYRAHLNTSPPYSQKQILRIGQPALMSFFLIFSMP